MSREHTVRAAGADRSFQKFILGKFPGVVPDLRGPGPWRLSRQEEHNVSEWLLQGGETTTAEGEAEVDAALAKFRGVPDAGLTGTPSNYFILIKDKGSNDFLAIPVNEWATFKAIQRRTQLSLEDAEAQMKFRRLQAERANPRIAQAIGDEDIEGGAAAAAAAAAAGGDEEADSDEEWKDIKARAASLAEMRAKGVANRNHLASGNKNKGDDDGAADTAEALGVDGAVYVPKPRDAEDWEHEGEAADDDLDMGGGSEGEVDVSPARAPAFSDSDGEGDMDAAKVKKAIRRMMKETGLEESEGSELSEDDGDDDEDDGDLDDLDRMASEVLPSAAPGGGGEAAVGRKRKSPTPISETVPPAGPVATNNFTPVSQAVEDAAVAATAAKKAKIAAAAAAAAAAVPSPPISPAAATGAPTEAEVIALIKSHGRMLLKDLSNAFTGRLKTKEERQVFSAMIKKVGKLTTDGQGNKFVILK